MVGKGILVEGFELTAEVTNQGFFVGDRGGILVALGLELPDELAFQFGLGLILGLFTLGSVLVTGHHGGFLLFDDYVVLLDHDRRGYYPLIINIHLKVRSFSR